MKILRMLILVNLAVVVAFSGPASAGEPGVSLATPHAVEIHPGPVPEAPQSVRFGENPLANPYQSLESQISDLEVERGISPPEPKTGVVNSGKVATGVELGVDLVGWTLSSPFRLLKAGFGAVGGIFDVGAATVATATGKSQEKSQTAADTISGGF